MQRGRKWNRLGDFWLGIPLVNALATLRRRGRSPERVMRVGVMCSPALGDTLLFSAVLQDIRAQFSIARITHFCMRQNLAAAEIIPGADQRVVIDLTKPLETILRMRAEKVDILFDFSSWQRLTAFYTLMSGAKYTVGFRTAGQYRGRAYDLAVEHRNDRHEIENFRSLLAETGIATGTPARVVIEPLQGNSALKGETWEQASDVVVFHLWAAGQRSSLREWPEENWISLAERLSDRNTLFVITGAPSDLPRSEAFVGKMEKAGLQAVAFAGRDGFRALARLLGRARVVVSVNTGVMHLAAIVGAPTVSLNGPTATHRWGPVGDCVTSVEPPDGSGGYLNLGFEFDRQPEDVMKRVTVEQVVKAVESLSSKRKQSLVM
jgi:heptosyltransferase-3